MYDMIESISARPRTDKVPELWKLLEALVLVPLYPIFDESFPKPILLSQDGVALSLTSTSE